MPRSHMQPHRQLKQKTNKQEKKTFTTEAGPAGHPLPQGPVHTQAGPPGAHWPGARS